MKTEKKARFVTYFFPEIHLLVVIIMRCQKVEANKGSSWSIVITVVLKLVSIVHRNTLSPDVY